MARQIGVTQPLLYRYFPSKEALIDRVYSEIYRWDPLWDALIADRTVDLQARLTAFYQAYSSVMLTRPLIRTFIFAGLAREGINTRYLEQMCERVLKPVIDEIRESTAHRPPPTKRRVKSTWNWCGVCMQASSTSACVSGLKACRSQTVLKRTSTVRPMQSLTAHPQCSSI
ncbi:MULTISPECIES: TetR/AcrR family transcriptional regulator [unclassified Caballeronia]|uniref:TetR/AcrR family transcriptional regulator n=1 Tax=unclassified Caballeronia TaxID=2646786 RepID=UPI00286B138F|nr:TetR/AcrR family transcriptional regulator [Caballeronia sp. LZ002]